MSISLQTLYHVICLEIELLKRLNDFIVNWNFIQPYDDIWGGIVTRPTFYHPFMISDLLNRKSTILVVIKYIGNEIFYLSWNATMKTIFSWQYFCVKGIRIRILERQVSTNHSEKNNTTWPNVYSHSIVFLPFDHLRSCVARRSTWSFQFLLLLVSIRKPEINNF